MVGSALAVAPQRSAGRGELAVGESGVKTREQLKARSLEVCNSPKSKAQKEDNDKEDSDQEAY